MFSTVFLGNRGCLRYQHLNLKFIMMLCHCVLEQLMIFIFEMKALPCRGSPSDIYYLQNIRLGAGLAAFLGVTLVIKLGQM